MRKQNKLKIGEIRETTYVQIYNSYIPAKEITKLIIVHTVVIKYHSSKSLVILILFVIFIPYTNMVFIMV